MGRLVFLSVPLVCRARKERRWKVQMLLGCCGDDDVFPCAPDAGLEDVDVAANAHVTDAPDIALHYHGRRSFRPGFEHVGGPVARPARGSPKVRSQARCHGFAPKARDHSDNVNGRLTTTTANRDNKTATSSQNLATSQKPHSIPSFL